jgi:lipopolysaccharide export LptBFGC system permease protein LptF
MAAADPAGRLRQLAGLEAPVNRLDRHLLRLFLRHAALVAVATLVVFLTLDVLLTMHLLVRKTPDGATIFVEYFLCRLPELANFALPVSALVSALVCAGPMLRRGEFIALSAAGIGPRRATRAILLGCLLLGGMDTIIADQLTPHATARTLAIQDLLEGQNREGRVWRVPESNSTWFASGAKLVGVAQPQLTQVVVATGSSLAHLDRLSWNGTAWQADQPWVEMRGQGAQQILERRAPGPLTGEIALPLTPEALYRRLLPRYTMSSTELFARGERADVAEVCGRWTRLLLPFLAAMMALPGFVRFLNTHRLAVAAVQASGMAVIPIGILVLGVLSADTMPVPPWIAVPLAVLVAAMPGWVRWLRWRL